MTCTRRVPVGNRDAQHLGAKLGAVRGGLVGAPVDRTGSGFVSDAPLS